MMQARKQRVHVSVPLHKCDARVNSIPAEISGITLAEWKEDQPRTVLYEGLLWLRYAVSGFFLT